MKLNWHWMEAWHLNLRDDCMPLCLICRFQNMNEFIIWCSEGYIIYRFDSDRMNGFIPDFCTFFKPSEEYVEWIHSFLYKRCLGYREMSLLFNTPPQLKLQNQLMVLL